METLVLSASYEPVARVVVAARGHALVGAEGRGRRGVRGPRDPFGDLRDQGAVGDPVPAGGSRPQARGQVQPRERVRAGQRRCQYCCYVVPRPEATYDHVVPRAQGGKTTWENVVIACVPCNQKKGGRTPSQAGMRLASTPVKPKKLPESVRITLGWQPGMPSSWRSWLRDFSYWNGELENDGG